MTQERDREKKRRRRQEDRKQKSSDKRFKTLGRLK
jgi:hypothetical protein